MRWLAAILAFGVALIDPIYGVVQLYTILLFIGAVAVAILPPAGLALFILATLAALPYGWSMLIVFVPILLVGYGATRQWERRRKERQIVEERADRVDRYIRQQMGE